MCGAGGSSLKVRAEGAKINKAVTATHYLRGVVPFSSSWMMMMMKIGVMMAMAMANSFFLFVRVTSKGPEY